ncbi:MAG TPA: hypothetical protein VL173_16985 [Vicinamibacterales bacterium]|nr:hypothetical protein [Vicinamibacterales bacterium]
MGKGLLPIVMALVIGATPLAFDWCQIACAEATSAQAVEHSCHHHQAATAKHQVAGAPHACGHDDSLPPTDVAAASLNAPAVIAQVVIVTPPVLRPVAASVAAGTFVPISPPTLTTQLRV